MSLEHRLQVAEEWSRSLEKQLAAALAEVARLKAEVEELKTEVGRLDAVIARNPW